MDGEAEGTTGGRAVEYKNEAYDEDAVDVAYEDESTPLLGWNYATTGERRPIAPTL